MTGLEYAELHTLIPEMDQLTSAETRDRFRDAVHSDEYRPTDPSTLPHPRTAKHTNPGLDAYLDHLDWTDTGWGPISITEPIGVYPEYLPTDAAIETIREYEPLVEIAAGNGYWAFVLQEAGCRITPTEPTPPRIDNWQLTSDFFAGLGTGGISESDLEQNASKLVFDEYDASWTDITIADNTYIEENTTDTVLLCHPPKEPWVETVETQARENNQTLIYIGEWGLGQDALPFFFTSLDSNWTLIDEFPVYNWQSTSAHGYVFQPN